MGDLEYLLGRIAGYADYANDTARHQVDKQIRAWLGEAITDARVRLNPEGAVAERIDGLLFRCEFFDQRVERAVHHALFGRELVDRVHQLDRGIVEAADRIRDAADEGALSTALDDVARLLDERFGAIVDAPSR
jgi:hypothetical protein